MKGRRRESHSGEAKAAHDEAVAERELQRALRALGLNEGVVERIAQGRGGESGAGVVVAAADDGAAAVGE